MESVAATVGGTLGLAVVATLVRAIDQAVRYTFGSSVGVPVPLYTFWLVRGD